MLLRNLRVTYVNSTKYYVKTTSITVKIFTNRAVFKVTKNFQYKNLQTFCKFCKFFVKHFVNFVYMKNVKKFTAKQMVKFCTAKYCYEVYM